MNKILYAILITLTTLFSLPVLCTAQFYQPTHFSGTQVVGGLNVTVTGVGINPTPGAGSAFCVMPPLVYGAGNNVSGYNNSGYKFRFSNSITRIRIQLYNIQYRDSVSIFLNDIFYPVSASQITYPTSICSAIISAIALPNGMITTSFGGPSCGNSNYSGQLDITPNYPVDSTTVFGYIEGGVSNCGGTSFQFYFAYDTFAYIRKPYNDTVRCAGDTMRVPLYVSTAFNSGNTYTVQLSNAAGSFATPPYHRYQNR